MDQQEPQLPTLAQSYRLMLQFKQPVGSPYTNTTQAAGGSHKTGTRGERSNI